LNDFSDDILVAAGQRGDKRAYALLVKRHYRYVFGVCLGMLGNIHDAEDIAQDAMLRGFLKIKKLRSSEQFGEWILNAGIDLEEAIGRLPREYRLPLVMYYFDNKSTKTIGEKLNISYSGVCKRIRTARKELHRLLTEEVHNGQ
jgi:DNA-directed RNA polymerase specialized sigma24 family protein